MGLTSKERNDKAKVASTLIGLFVGRLHVRFPGPLEGGDVKRALLVRKRGMRIHWYWQLLNRSAVVK